MKRDENLMKEDIVRYVKGFEKLEFSPGYIFEAVEGSDVYYLNTWEECVKQVKMSIQRFWEKFVSSRYEFYCFQKNQSPEFEMGSLTMTKGGWYEN